MSASLKLYEFVDNALGDLDEIESFSRLIHTEQQQPCECVDGHDIVQITLNGFI